MTQQHPIAPPPELVQKWAEQFEAGRSLYTMFEDIYKAGADRELQACRMEIIDGTGLVLLDETNNRVQLANDLVNARRPKPPSLKEQALEQLDGIAAVFRMSHGGDLVCDTIRRALEQLHD